METSDSRLTEHRHLLSKCRAQEKKSHPQRQGDGINEYIHGNNPQKSAESPKILLPLQRIRPYDLERTY